MGSDLSWTARLGASLLLALALVGCSTDAKPASGESPVDTPHYPDSAIHVSLANLRAGRLVLGTAEGRTCVWLTNPNRAIKGRSAVLWPGNVTLFGSALGVRVVQKGHTVVRAGDLFMFSGADADPQPSENPCVAGLPEVRVGLISHE